MSNPTINDVAKVANTSKSTVSRYLNGHKVKKETQEALERAIKELNFHPNINARRLVKNNTQVIGVVVDDIANMFYADILRGIENIINKHGYQCAYYSRTSRYQGDYGFMDLANERQVDGIILVSFLRRSQEMLQKVIELPIPLALVGDAAGFNDDLFSVDVNNEFGVREIVQYLNRLGHRKIAYISGPPEFAASYWRQKGYEGALADLGLDRNEDWMVESDWSKEGGYKAMKQLLKMNNISAVISSNDEMAIGALLCARELGYEVPLDISIVGFDDIAVSKWVYPPLTSVRQPLYEMGKTAAEGLIQMLKNQTAAVKGRHLIDPTLIVRQSCRNLGN